MTATWDLPENLKVYRIFIVVIPSIGWVRVLIVNLLFTVFTVRHFTLVYDQGVLQPVLPESVVTESTL